MKSTRPQEYWARIGFGRETDRNFGKKVIEIEQIYLKYKQIALCPTSHRRPVRWQSQPYIPVLDEPITEAEVLVTLCEVPSSSSSGSTIIPTAVFKRLVLCGAFLCVFVWLLNLVYRFADIHPSWSEGQVTPVPKPGKRCALTIYGQLRSLHYRTASCRK